MNPVRWSLRYPQVILVLAAMLFVVGLYSLMTMPRREDPHITIRTGLVAALYPGATPEQVEQQVTRKIEERLFRFEEVRKAKTFSTSRYNLVIVNVELEDWVKDPDLFWSKLRHNMLELRATEMPQGVRGPIVNSDFGDTVAMLIAIEGDRYGYRELKDYAIRIEDELRTLRAVSKIRRYGEQKEEILITGSLERLSRYAVDPLKIIGALQARNTVAYAGNLDTAREKVPLRATGLFRAEDQIRKTMVDVSRVTGQPVYIGNLAEVERRYQDPKNLTRFSGTPCLMLSVEMQRGYNIVDFGDEVRAKLAHLKPLLPPDLHLHMIADQPKVVEERIQHFIREFGIAIGAVILVTLLLLPFRVALIAAVAIPVTVAITFGVMNALGIELHQVSIASLIVVLGMVVDDAIVIADNYVELLDRGLSRQEAAALCSTELAIPVLTATLTIIASFLPLLMLSGAVGEFIRALPITVAVALGSSYVVAMLLTPLLCRFFIHTGLHRNQAGNSGGKRGLLDRVQEAYNWLIVRAMNWKRTTVAAGLVTFLGGLFLLYLAPQQFFPSAERNQFVADVWMPEGTRIETTDKVVRRIEEYLSKQEMIESFTTFIGASAPRFYYNVDPQQPADNYAQILVNTTSEEKTPAYVHQLRKEMWKLAPEAMVIVKELQQGVPISAPIEVRLSGAEIDKLKGLGAEVAQILDEVPGSAYVHNDFREDTYDVAVELNHEVANRLGLTNFGVARLLAGGFDGAPVSTFWEGDRAVDIVLRLEDERRRSFEDVRDVYLYSALTGARVPLREVATLKPEWHTSRIIRRNGVRTLTVRNFYDEGWLASEVLDEAAPKIEALPLPDGYRLEYGGETESQAETFQEMLGALGVSILAIYLILLFQFRSATEPFIIMASIPLSLVGAALGLILTSNPFGFTAFMGLISLSGIVVRNAIILVDYIHERLKDGVDLVEAATEAGERRMRPIFLTSMAAAVGVTPMILSGSSLWSPLASVIAVGLICSMFFTLVVVPVLFVLAREKAA